MNLSKVLLFFSFTTISSISSAVSAVEYKKTQQVISELAAQEYLYSPVQMVAGSIGDAMLFFQYETVSIRISGYLKRPLHCL